MSLQLQRNVSLQPFNTLGIDVQAAELVVLTDNSQCEFLPSICAGKRLLILGGGSNLVLAGDFNGLVILNRLRGVQCLQQDADSVTVKVAAGENWDAFVEYTLLQGWHGLENLSAIPGTVGAAPVQNIGAYGVEVKDYILAVEILCLTDGKRRSLKVDECEFAYRDSIFKTALKDQYLITHVTFRLPKHPAFKLDYGEIRSAMQQQGLDESTLTPLQVRELIAGIRGKKLPDPSQLPNVGSFFKNPVISLEQFEQLRQRWPDLVAYPLNERQVKIAAGWLLDRLGWKGRQMGQARVHDRQALVLINQSRDAEDLLRLKNAIQLDVVQQTGIVLEMEPLLIGAD